MEREVNLEEVLSAREARANSQTEWMDRLGLPVVSFCLNIAGPVKNSPILRRAFHEGLDQLEDNLTAVGFTIAKRRELDQPTGCEALWAIQGTGQEIKQLCVALEENHPLGRLYDFDVLEPGRGAWERSELGFSPRRCLVCGREGKGCASRRLHSVAELQQVTSDLLRRFFAQQDSARIGNLAGRALLYEVCTTPKPGLVDRHNNGSHRDMDLFTFLDSTTALIPYFQQAVSCGQQTADLSPEETFRLLRPAGLWAERAMNRATGGVNTHKGAIFSLGTLCAAVGRLWNPAGEAWNIPALLEQCSNMTRSAVQETFSHLSSDNVRTVGQRLYLKYGLSGIRGELASGLPSVQQIGLPALHSALNAGATLEEAGVSALLSLLSSVTDTNLIARGGLEGLHWVKQRTQGLSQVQVDQLQIAQQLDEEFISRNLSPGGCADLLAITYFLFFLEQLS